jgi:glutathione S-transferase
MILYELCGLNDRRYSLFAWRTRMALAHKGLPVEYRGVRVSDKASIAFSNQGKVPVLRDGERVIVDSWRIAEYLEQSYPSAPSLFGGATGQALARFINTWADRQAIPAVAPVVACDLPSRVDAEDGAHLRAVFEKAFGQTLEQMREERDGRLKQLRRTFDVPRVSLKTQPFLSGEEPAYADFILFSVFQWARLVGTAEILAADDPLVAWRERMLDLYSGLARSSPARSDAAG